MPAPALHEGWVIANHILVSFHVAFISSVLSLPAASIFKTEVLKFIFFSPETLVSALYLYVSFHTGIAIHELGHFLAAARLTALNERSQREAEAVLRRPFIPRALGIIRLFLLAPYGKAAGIKRDGLNYHPDAPYNLAVAAAGPRISRNLAWVMLTPAVVLLAVGTMLDVLWAIYAGRLCLGIGIVGLLDFLLADTGKYAEFKKRESRAQEKAATIKKTGDWWDAVGEAKQRMLGGRIQSLNHPRLGTVTAPWQFRNCGMGGRHTEKEYPESNVSMQEAMFLILGARDYQEAQEITVRLQNRLKEIIENEEGCRVMGIGLEGGLAPYIERGSYPLPEVRLWAMMKQTMEECGYQPGVDVAIALDPAMSELEIAYRKQFKVPDSVGMYLFWRDKTQTVMDHDGVLDLYMKAIQEYNIPILSIEDGFSENDYEGWQKLLDALGDRVFVIGDDLVTTNDQTIEIAAAKGLINTVLIKANQIGTLYETILAMLVSLGKGFELVVSHRSKSPNDDMEAQIALAANCLGLKAGGGANTERLVKYQAVNEIMLKGPDDFPERGVDPGLQPRVRRVVAYEEPTNAGVPSVGSTIEIEMEAQGVRLKFKGATPLGTSAGAGEAIHLVDSAIEHAEHHEVIERHPSFFVELEPGVSGFAKEIKDKQVKSSGDDDLIRVFNRAQRYDGKGCLNAVANVFTVIAPVFEGQDPSELSLKDIDRMLLSLELREAQRRKKLSPSASAEDRVQAMQRKQNLGMNAILSVSLALARAQAHLQGKDLFEMLREEMLAIIERLASDYTVEIPGSRFADYVAALQHVDRIVTGEGGTLYETLRNLTGIYQLGGTGRPDTPRPARRRPEPTTEQQSGKAEPTAPRTDTSQPVPATGTAPKPVSPSLATATLEASEKKDIAALNEQFYGVFRRDPDRVTREAVMRQYMSLRQPLAERLGQFEIVNHRIYRGPNGMVIPYMIGDTLLIYRGPNGSGEAACACPVQPGTIITDPFVKQLAEFEGDPVDLEPDLFELDPVRYQSVRVNRIRDIAAQLARISKGANHADALFLLRIMAARLSLFSFKRNLSAKNLQTEIRTLVQEFLKFLNSPLYDRLPFLVRILVRNISSVVTKPKLIDRLWNDTIDLAEVHLRGSDIVNEIRRSTHHAMGRRTLQLVQAYLEYLESGNREALAELGYNELSPADEKARQRTDAKEIVTRIQNDLEELLGNADVISRIRDWQTTYAETLLRCETDKSLWEEADRIVAESIQEHNRWSFYHHLRIIRNRISQFPLLAAQRESAERTVEKLLSLKPDAPDFDARNAESELRRCTDDFGQAVQSAYQDGLFRQLGELTTSFHQVPYFDTFAGICQLRQTIRDMLREPAFPEQRLLLSELDCLLEEMGYVSVRHVASQYDDTGVDLPQCLKVIHLCIQNLTHDGLYARQLEDLGEMLTDGSYTYAELENTLQQIQRNYQHILRWIIAPFEKMQARLDLDEEELRSALANMQRFLHDLNSVAFFADTALSHIEHRISDTHQPIGPAADSDAPRVSNAIVHLSHGDEIRGLVDGKEGPRNVRRSYGGKGSGLVYISYLNLPVPDGFLIPTTASPHHAQGLLDARLDDIVLEHLATLEADISGRCGEQRGFGLSANPILVSVRGGSVFSMPGILSTVLFVGMNDEIAESLAARDPWHAYDSYRRFLASYAEVVWDIDIEKFNLVDQAKERHGVKFKDELPWEAMREVVASTKEALRNEGLGQKLDEILSDPRRQLLAAVRAVYDSWNVETAKRYRALKGISDTWQTAVIVQEMSSGNRPNEDIHPGMDESQASLTGVIAGTQVTEFGMRECIGEFKFSACGNDLVGGLTSSATFHPFADLRLYMPMLNRRLHHSVDTLRRFMGTDQEIEFTVERGVLSVLQARAAEVGANRTNYAFEDPGKEITQGIGIRGSAFRGLVAFDEADCQSLRTDERLKGDDVDGILMMLENPSPADIPLVLQVEGLLTAKGGSTSHAAIAINSVENRDFSAVMSAVHTRVKAREHEAVITDEQGAEVARIRTGDIISIDGTKGTVYLGSRPVARA
jgi:enolase